VDPPVHPRLRSTSTGHFLTTQPSRRDPNSKWNTLTARSGEPHCPQATTTDLGEISSPTQAVGGSRLRDAISNDIEVVTNGDDCPIYDHPLPAGGLKFSDLVAWWTTHPSCPSDLADAAIARDLYQRLTASLASPPEFMLFRTYYARFKDNPDVTALVPQVYLHYDPHDQRTRRTAKKGTPLARQRMDFLMLFSDRKRVVIEVDGKQHYAAGETASPRLYSAMVAEDRRLKLAGYKVFRFGGYELGQAGAEAMLNKFFDEVHSRMS